MFHVGQLVICVDDKFIKHAARGFACPKSGVIYTIREVIPERSGVFLHEVRNPPYPFVEGYLEPGFAMRRFRPIDDSRIEIFRAALRTAPIDRENVE